MRVVEERLTSKEIHCDSVSSVVIVIKKRVDFTFSRMVSSRRVPPPEVIVYRRREISRGTRFNSL